MKKDLSLALPLLFAGLLLTAGIAAFLLPLFNCPDCGLLDRRMMLAKVALRLNPSPASSPLCWNCRDTGRVAALRWLFGSAR